MKNVFSLQDDANIITKLKAIVGEIQVLTGKDVQARTVSWGEEVPCESLVIARPENTEQVSQLVKLANQEGRKIVVHGGRTGLVGALQEAQGTIAISLERLQQVEPVDLKNRSVVVGAGVTLESVQNIAAENALFFALDIGSRGSATIGGTISTNAGGLNVIRFGMMREQVLGLEVVTGDGEIINMMHSLIKNNAGYDLKHLFIGAEGTLGIVTRATLRLRFKAPQHNTAFLALPNLDTALNLLHSLENELTGQVSAFEVMWPEFYQRVTSKLADSALPLAKGYPLYVLLESLSSGDHDKDRFLSALEKHLENEQVLDAVIANSERESSNFWALREDIEALMSGGPTAHFDLALSSSDITSYLGDVIANVLALKPSAVIMPFGHLGDNNLHLSINLPDGQMSELAVVKEAVYHSLKNYKGSVSAEHGIGTQKKDYLALSKNDSEITMMKLLKATLDPNNTINSNLMFK